MSPDAELYIAMSPPASCSGSSTLIDQFDLNNDSQVNTQNTRVSCLFTVPLPAVTGPCLTPYCTFQLLALNVLLICYLRSQISSPS